jgi:predicted MPP superfamily phosphohydrolase
LKKKLLYVVLLVYYWLPATIIALAMGILAVRGIALLNKSLYLTVVGVCVFQYLIKFLLFIFVLLYDLIFVVVKRIFKKVRVIAGRRVLLYFFFLFYVISLILMIYGMIWGVDNFQIREVNIEIESMNQQELTIVQLSDLHLASWKTPASLEKAIQMANELQPDIIFLTGDFVQFVSEEMVEYLPILSKLKARYGIYSVLGNHDYGRYARFSNDSLRKADVQNLIAYQTSLGWKVLNNESVRLFWDSLPIGITIAGMEYYSPKKMFINEGDLNKTFEKIDTTDFVILLSHDPQAWYDVLDQNLQANLTLSGHTHGMQLGYYSENLKFSPASILYKQWGGLYEKQGKFLYVNIGLGVVGFPVRIGMPPEITIIYLTRNVK